MPQVTPPLNSYSMYGRSDGSNGLTISGFCAASFSDTYRIGVTGRSGSSSDRYGFGFSDSSLSAAPATSCVIRQSHEQNAYDCPLSTPMYGNVPTSTLHVEHSCFTVTGGGTVLVSPAAAIYQIRRVSQRGTKISITQSTFSTDVIAREQR